MKLLILIRGLPGAGKTTLAEKLVVKQNHLEADMFHMRRNQYQFEYDLIENAHEWCRLETERKMRSGYHPIVVSNTFTTNDEMKLYIELAKKYEYNYQVIAIENIPFESKHNVPQDVIDKMQDRWEMFEEEID